MKCCSTEYVAGMAFPLDNFSNSNQNGLFHALKGRLNAEHWIREKGYYGFTEWHSNTYYEEDMLALLNIYDFGEENGLLGFAKCCKNRLTGKLERHHKDSKEINPHRGNSGFEQ